MVDVISLVTDRQKAKRTFQSSNIDWVAYWVELYELGNLRHPHHRDGLVHTS